MKLWIERMQAGLYRAQVGPDTYYVAKRKGLWRVDRCDGESGELREVAGFTKLADADQHVRALPVTRRNIMSGKEFQERADTPYYCSPSSETYWSS
jgi:hypothetical protein